MERKLCLCIQIAYFAPSIWYVNMQKRTKRNKNYLEATKAYIWTYNTRPSILFNPLLTNGLNKGLKYATKDEKILIYIWVVYVKYIYKYNSHSLMLVLKSPENFKFNWDENFQIYCRKWKLGQTPHDVPTRF